MDSPGTGCQDAFRTRLGTKLLAAQGLDGGCLERPLCSLQASTTRILGRVFPGSGHAPADPRHPRSSQQAAAILYFSGSDYLRRRHKQRMKSTICLAEDREVCEPALKLLLLSLNRDCPGTAINLFYPPAKEGFLTWMERCPQVRLQTDRLKSGCGWNVKPQAIMHLIDQGFEEVIWIDSDVIVNQTILPIFSGLRSGTLVATEHTLAEERCDANALRARLWGLPVGRALPFALSSGVLRVTKNHYHLMERWWELLQSNKYQDFQKKEWRQRPVHMLGDQDVLTALLTSEEFSQIPIHILRRGKHILQFDGVFGYSIAERMTNLLGEGPAFIHSGAGKPWSERWRVEPANSLREYIKMVYLDVSPYTLSALRFKEQLGCDTEWMEPHFVLSRILRTLGMGYPALVGLPMAVFADLTRVVRYIRKSHRSNLSQLETSGTETVGNG